MAQVVDRSGGEGALRTLEVQAVLTGGRRRRPEVAGGARSTSVDQDVIKEHQDTAAQERLEDDVHECLERRGRVGQVKGPNMARGRVNSLFKKSTNSLEQEVSK